MQPPPPTSASIPFAANAVRLSLRQWVAVAVLLGFLASTVPALWKGVEPLPDCPNDRVPFRLGNDYWTFARYARRAAAAEQTVVLGDSVIWGHYVGKDGTLAAHLNSLRRAQRYANLGVDGIHPAALAGLIDCFGSDLKDRSVILHCNLLWMSSRRHDLTDVKEFAFNHPSLVPQFWPSIPCYEESLSGRLGNVVGRNVGFLSWARHLQIAYLDGADWASWTIEHPYENPLRQITLQLPSPDEPPSPPPATRPWTAQGIPLADFRWVELDESLQWRSFRRVVDVLRQRGNRLFVLVGPFNEHMLKPRSLAAYRSRLEAVDRWLAEQGIPRYVAKVLPSEMYGDASHPLDAGYALLARQLLSDDAFRRFCPLDAVKK